MLDTFIGFCGGFGLASVLWYWAPWRALSKGKQSDTLQKFNKDSRCVKCGFSAISTYVHEHNRIKRTCASCGYSWMELPSDFKEPDLSGQREEPS